jgi:hypothetical protein
MLAHLTFGKGNLVAAKIVPARSSDEKEISGLRHV